MKKITLKKLMFTMVALLCSAAVTAHDFEVDGIYYNITQQWEVNGEVAVTYKGDSYDSYIDEYSGVIVIPEQITCNGGTYVVTCIGDDAFRDCAGLTEVTIPNSVTNIRYCAFYDCSNLTNVTIPNSVIWIGNNVFNSCSSLTNITIPNSVTNIGQYAFQGCSNLTNVTIPNSVIWIGSYAFDGCTGLKEVHINDLAAWCNISMEWDGNPLNYAKEFYLNGELLTDIVIPEEITVIRNWVFKGYDNLKSVIIHDKVTRIGSNAFDDCNTLTSITIPSSVTSIGNNAFYNCSNIKNVYISDLSAWCKINFETDGSNPLNTTSENKPYVNLYLNGKQVKELVIPNDITDLKDNTFLGANVSSIELHENIKSIGSAAISKKATKLICKSATPPTIKPYGETGFDYNIAAIYVPRGCKSAYEDVSPWGEGGRVIVEGDGVSVSVNVTPGMMGEEILGHVNYLHEVNHLTLKGSINSTDISHIKNSMPNLLSIDMSGLDMESIPAEMFYGRKALQSVILPNNVKTINSRAFYGCNSIEKMILPEGLTTIGNETFKNCNSLKTVSFPSTLKQIDRYAFAACTLLTNVTLPNGITNIGKWAFSNCSSIEKITLPKSLKTVSSGAFYYCCGLKEVIIEKGVESLGNYSGEENEGVFYYCSSLEKVSLPEGLVYICDNTFYSCSKLDSVNIPEGVRFIGYNAFAYCNNLKNITMPTTLEKCGTTPFKGCSSLSNVECAAFFPPQLTDGLMSLDDMGSTLKRTLYVPEWTIAKYKLATSWAAFNEILPIKGDYPTTINVAGNQTLSLPSNGLPTGYKPNLNILNTYTNEMGRPEPTSLNFRGNGTLSLNNFTLANTLGYYYSPCQLLNEAKLEAENVTINMELDNTNYYGNQLWYFVSFPFDVRISDITANCDWVIRKYDGKARANADYSSTWVTVPYDSVLHAGEGYIWACSGGNFTVPAMNNNNKNRIFANEALTVALKDYLGDNSSDNSWNLTGNPFPCYYDTREMDYTAPITVWNRDYSTYTAYSPVDDSYILAPFEAFFVQKPANVSNISFSPDGRQLSSSATDKNNKRAAQKAYSTKKRSIVNLTLSNAECSDRTRLVINEDAKMDYEMSCDAAKFMSTDAKVPQLYSVMNNEMFAINERPMNDGIIKLGTHIGAAGSYTIEMQGESDMKVVLVDLKTGTETELNNGAYTFDTEVADEERFLIKLYDGDVTDIDNIAEDTKVTTTDEGIVVTASSDVDMEVYNAAGSLVAKAYGQTEKFAVEPGVYIVKINGIAHRVVVSK